MRTKLCRLSTPWRISLPSFQTQGYPLLPQPPPPQRHSLWWLLQCRPLVTGPQSQSGKLAMGCAYGQQREQFLPSFTVLCQRTWKPRTSCGWACWWELYNGSVLSPPEWRLGELAHVGSNPREAFHLPWDLNGMFIWVCDKETIWFAICIATVEGKN